MCCILSNVALVSCDWYPTFAPTFWTPSKCVLKMCDFPFFMILLVGYHPSYLHDFFMLVSWFRFILWYLGSRKCREFYFTDCCQWYILGFSFLLLLISIWLFPLILMSYRSLQLSHKFYISLFSSSLSSCNTCFNSLIVLKFCRCFNILQHLSLNSSLSKFYLYIFFRLHHRYCHFRLHLHIVRRI